MERVTTARKLRVGFTPKEHDDDLSSNAHRQLLGVLGIALPLMVYITAGFRPLKVVPKPWFLLDSIKRLLPHRRRVHLHWHRRRIGRLPTYLRWLCQRNRLEGPARFAHRLNTIDRPCSGSCAQLEREQSARGAGMSLARFAEHAQLQFRGFGSSTFSKNFTANSQNSIMTFLSNSNSLRLPR